MNAAKPSGLQIGSTRPLSRAERRAAYQDFQTNLATLQTAFSQHPSPPAT
ncbi:hypothetical protein MAHJHV35_47170 [Mycobacterium avium subsp. hominissuis]